MKNLIKNIIIDDWLFKVGLSLVLALGGVIFFSIICIAHMIWVQYK